MKKTIPYLHLTASFMLLLGACNHNTGTLTDSRDGQTYKWVKIGEQIWMAENLRYLPHKERPFESVTLPLYYVYDDFSRGVSTVKSSSNFRNYGVLYNWPAASIACPPGWHLPKLSEYEDLINYLGGANAAYLKMKSKRTYPDSHPRWEKSNDKATNESKWSGLPGGRYDVDIGGERFGLRALTSFKGAGGIGHWWTSDRFPKPVNIAFAIRMQYNHNKVVIYNTNTQNGFSVRCIKDNVRTEVD